MLVELDWERYLDPMPKGLSNKQPHQYTDFPDQAVIGPAARFLPYQQKLSRNSDGEPVHPLAGHLQGERAKGVATCIPQVASAPHIS